MYVKFAHLCDYALIAQDGKPSIVGIFTRVMTQEFPCQLPKAVIFVCIGIGEEDVDRTGVVNMRMLNPEGQETFGVEAEVSVAELPPHKQMYIMGEVGLEFGEPGPYELLVSADKGEPIRVEFIVQQAQ